MAAYLARRLLLALVTIWAISVVTFVIIQLPPGDVVDAYIANLSASGSMVSAHKAEALRALHGLDQPIRVRYPEWAARVVQGDVGMSMEWGRPVGEVLGDRLWLTVLVSLLAILVTWGLASPIGIYSAVRQYSIADYMFTFVGFVGIAVPSFLLTLVVMYFGFTLFDADVGGLFSKEFELAPWSRAELADLLGHLPLPVLILALAGIPQPIRVTRADLLDELREPDGVTARARGLGEHRVILEHPVRAALELFEGRTLGIVGESRCGKTTTARCILRAIEPTAGAIRFRTEIGRCVDGAALPRAELGPLRRRMQMIVQDPFGSSNPRMTIADIVGEPLLVNGTKDVRERRRVAELFDMVQLPTAYMNRFPHAFSGGQRQRIGIARALALEPALVVADKPVSALDVSVQAQIVNLPLDLQDRLGLSYLFVAHDLSVVKHMSHRVAVMDVGRIVELAPTEDLLARPLHPYTEALLSAVPVPDPRRRAKRIVLEGEVADPSRPPPGCAFHPRFRYAVERCRREVKALRPILPVRAARFHRAEELDLRGVASPAGTGVPARCAIF